MSNFPSDKEAAVEPTLPGDHRPSDRAGPARVGMLSVHTSPLAQPGTGDSGGLNVYVLSLAHRLAAAGVGVDIFTRATGEDLPRTIRVGERLAVHHLLAGPPGARKDDLAAHLCAFSMSLSRHPVIPQLELVHSHYWMSGWVGRHARRRLGLPLVQTFHTLASVKNDAMAPGAGPEPGLRLAAERRIVADADAIIASTPAEADVLRRVYGANGSRLRVIEPGVDLQTFHPNGDRGSSRRGLGLEPADAPLLLFVGRLQPHKAPDLAVRTLAAVNRRLGAGGPARLVVVGGPSGPDGPAVGPAALRRLADELGVGSHVAFLAPRPQPELAVLYRAADVVLVPSYSESFGLVAMEAQACGTPVVGAAVDGLRHAVAPGAGRLVGSRRPEDLATAVLPYLTDARARAAAGAAGVAAAARRTWERTAEDTLAVYRGVLGLREADTAGARGA